MPGVAAEPHRGVSRPEDYDAAMEVAPMRPSIARARGDDTGSLEVGVIRLRSIESVLDAYRVTPAA
jgi:hypothetical protein